MTQHAGLFVQQQDVFILIHDVQLGGAHLQVGVFLPGLFKELIVDVKLQNVPGGKAGVPLGSLAVALDALEADVFLQKRIRQQRHCLAHKAVQPLTGVVLTDP